VSIPRADFDEIMSALSALFLSDQVVELRAIGTIRGRKVISAGYFDGEHRAALAQEAVRLNSTGAQVYVTMNVLDPQLLGRYANRVEPNAGETTSDANVLRRSWLLLDFDPCRPKGTSATDDQFRAAKAQARACCQALRDEGLPEPLQALSGNGYHLLYPIDLPNDETSRDLIQNALKGLAARFDTDAVKLDQSVFNSARITKLYGTVAAKGDNTPQTPWRVSRLRSAPARTGGVSPEQLRAVSVPIRARRAAERARHSEFDLESFLVTNQSVV
jgi:hypothetical protein